MTWRGWLLLWVALSVIVGLALGAFIGVGNREP